MLRQVLTNCPEVLGGLTRKQRTYLRRSKSEQLALCSGLVASPPLRPQTPANCRMTS